MYIIFFGVGRQNLGTPIIRAAPCDGLLSLDYFWICCNGRMHAKIRGINKHYEAKHFIIIRVSCQWNWVRF